MDKQIKGHRSSGGGRSADRTGGGRHKKAGAGKGNARMAGKSRVSTYKRE